MEEYRYKLKAKGKSLTLMLQLKENIEKGWDCAVVTLDPENYKKDFERATGIRLYLRPRGKGIYTAFF